MKSYKKIFIISALVVAIGIMMGCGSKETLIGQWKSTDGSNTTYQFNEDGTGIEKKGDEITKDITYTTEGDKLTITKELLGQKQSEEYTYILETKKLKLTKNSNTIEFSKSSQ